MEKILSIQSHTVYGYVGNKAAVFPLQLLGFDVSYINSVQFSNHTGYKNGCTGEVLSGMQLHQLQQGLEQNNILSKFNGLLTGYMGSVSFLEAVASLVKTLKKKNVPLFYCCDPVIGDHGRGFYVPKALVLAYKTKILPVADMLTPNQFEVEQLTGRTIHNQDDLLSAIEALHEMGVKRIIVTSTQFGDKSLYASVCINDKTTVLKATFKNFEGSFTGTGDLLAALLLGWTRICPENIQLTLLNSLKTMQAVLHRTKISIEKGENDERELKLIESRDDIISPPEKYSVAITPC